jgi:molecular chaperone DnaK
MAKQELGLGIDLGTTISLASVVDSTGRPQVVTNRAGKHLIPSAIYFETNVMVGDAALDLGLLDPDGLAEAFKRDIGKAHFSREIRGNQVPPEVLTALLLRHLMGIVNDRHGELDSAVITVPAYFDERKRTATQQAAKLAGLDVIEIINEPTSAAIALGHDLMLKADQTITRPKQLLVYDLGGGTFDVTLLEFSDFTFRAVATDGDIYLGGRDFDERIIAIIAERFRDRHGVDPRMHLTEMQRLWKRAREIKHALSDRTDIPIEFEYEGMNTSFNLSRSEFEEAIEPLVDRSIATTRDVVEAAGKSFDEIDEILLVGGSSRIPMVVRKVEQLTGKKAKLTPNPDELIAHGAALYAATKKGGILDSSAQFDFVNVNAHSLGVRGTDVATKQKINKILIPRNTPLPASRVHRFVTSFDGQRSARVPLLEGESENPDYCNVLGECMVRIDRPIPKGSVIKVICNYAANGTISVTAKLPQTNASAYVEIRRDSYSTIESLDIWTARLTSQGQQSATNVLESIYLVPLLHVKVNQHDKAQVLSRLDSIHRYIGQLATDSPPPVNAVQTHRLVGLLRDETESLKHIIQQLELHHQQTEQFRERLLLSGQIAQLKMAWENSKRLLDHSMVALGRECLADGFMPSPATEFAEEVRELQSFLD